MNDQEDIPQSVEPVVSPTQGSSTLKEGGTLESFWSSFNLFSRKFDRYSLKYWYSYIIGYYVLLLTVDIFLDNYVNQHVPTVSILPLPGKFPYTKLDLTNGLLISATVAVILIMLAFNNWANRIRTTFKTLLEKGHINQATQGVDLHSSYLTFLNEYQHNLSSKKRYILVMLTVGVAIAYTFWVIFSKAPFINLNLQFFPPFYKFIWIAKGFIGLILPALFLGYFFAVAAWAMYCTGRHIKRLTMIFDLAIQKYHPDNCGGLKSLGDFCFATALPILIGGFILGIDGQPLNIYRQGFHFPDFKVAAIIFLFLLAVPLAAFAFFVPMWNIHQKMKAKKEEYAEEYASQIKKLEEQLRTASNKERFEEVRSIQDNMDILQRQHPDKVYPTWPFKPRILFIFVSPPFLGFLGLIFGLNADGLAVQLLKKFFAQLFGWN